jgi:hypothetical protein
MNEYRRGNNDDGTPNDCQMLGCGLLGRFRLKFFHHAFRMSGNGARTRVRKSYERISQLCQPALFDKGIWAGVWNFAEDLNVFSHDTQNTT